MSIWYIFININTYFSFYIFYHFSFTFITFIYFSFSITFITSCLCLHNHRPMPLYNFLIPVPSHLLLIALSLGFADPLPLHYIHIIFLSYFTSFLSSLYSFSKVIVFNFDLHFLFTFLLLL